MNEQVIRIDCIALTEEFPFMEDQCNILASTLTDSGADVHLEDNIMVVTGLTYDDVLMVLEDDFDINTLNIPEGVITEDYPMEDDEYMNESWDAYDDTYDDLEDEYAWNAEDEENMRIINSGRRPKASEMSDMFDDYDEMTENDEFDDDDMLTDDDMFCENDLDDMAFENEEIDECGSGDMFEDDCVDCNEDEDFMECLEESYNKRKNSCCPPKKGKLVNLSESLKSSKPKAKRKETLVINERIYTKAMKKLNESKKLNLRKSIKENLGEKKYNDVWKALTEGKSSLYTKKRINGKNIQEYTSKELHKLLKEVSEQIKTLTKKSKSINESKALDSIYDELETKKRLFNILDEELTYRLTYRKRLSLNEDEEKPATDDTTKEESTSEETSNTESAEESTEGTEPDAVSDENTEDPEKDEEVELARVIITVANQEAADTLKSELVDAGIPEDVIEFETESDDEDVEDTGSDTEEIEEPAEDNTEETEESGDTNESFHANVFKRLLEDEETPEAEGDSEGTDETNDESTEDAAEESDDTPVKVILTDTDHINTLAQVLSDVYGIEQEEFEEMIGGSIVNDEDSSESEETEDTEKSEETEDEPSSKGDDAIDNMSDEDLAQLFGESANK